MGAFALLLAGLVLALLLTGRLKRDGAAWIGGALAAMLAAQLFSRGQPLLGFAVAAAAGALLWRDRAKRRVAAMPMDEVEARRVLGVGALASRADILAAHRRRIAEAHPDRGGDEQEARRINAARDTLLKL